MTPLEALNEVFTSYERYYNIIRDNVTEPFDAEAQFISHNEQYYLIKAAKVADIDSNEYVFFKTEDVLTLEKFNELDKIAWDTGMSRVVPALSHKNTDVTLVIFADRIDNDCFVAVKKRRHYKSYCFSLKGYSNYRVIAVELKLKRFVCNRQGQSLKKMFVRYTK